MSLRNSGMKEVSEIVGVEVKQTEKSRKRSGFTFGQAEDFLDAVEEMKGNIEVLSGMVQDALDRLKAIQVEQHKPKLDLAAFDPLLSILRSFTHKDWAGKCFDSVQLAEKLGSERWKGLLPRILLKLAPVAGLKVDGQEVVLGPHTVE